LGLTSPGRPNWSGPRGPRPNRIRSGDRRVFLDAGAGPAWRYRDPKTGSAIGRSEGLGLASLAMFAGGAFSADPLEPLRADADVLANLAVADLELGMQVRDANPLIGMDGRAELYCAVWAGWWPEAGCVRQSGYARPGGLFERLRSDRRRKAPAPTILASCWQQLGPIWPSRLTLGGIASATAGSIRR